MQLRIAAERGKVREVKRLLEAGAKLTRDSVSGTVYDFTVFKCVVSLEYISHYCSFLLLYRTASPLYTRLLNGGTRLSSNCS